MLCTQKHDDITITIIIDITLFIYVLVSARSKRMAIEAGREACRHEAGSRRQVRDDIRYI